MPDLLSSLTALFNELKRRKVVRSAIMYGGGALGVLAAAELVVDTYGLDETIRRQVGMLVLIGFPVALVLSWMFDWTPEGVVRAERSPLPSDVRRGMMWIAAIVAVLGGAGAALTLALRSGDDAPPVIHITRPAPTIGILPLEGFDRVDSLAWLAPALAATLEGGLSEDPIVLRSRSAVAAYHARGLPLDSLAAILGVEYFVALRLVGWGDSVTVQAQLIDGSTSTLRGAGSVTRATAGPLVLVDALADGLEAILRRELGWETRIREWRAGTADPVAYELRYRAEERRAAARSIRVADAAAAHAQLLTADSLLEVSQRRDPRWVEVPLARAELAIDLDLTLAAMHALQRPDLVAAALDRGISHANSALRIEPGSPEAHAIRGQLLYRKVRVARADAALQDSLLRRAEEDLRVALREEPHLTPAAISLSDLLFTHRLEYADAREFALRALETDAYLEGASRIIWRIAMASHELGEDGEAIRWCREGVRRFPHDPRHYSCFLDVMAWGGLPPQPDSAWRLLGTVIDFLPPQNRSGRDHYTMAVAAVLARAGMADSAAAVVRRVTATSPESATAHLESAVRFRMGDVDRARALFDRFQALDRGDADRLAASRMFRDYLDRPPG